MSPGLCAAYGKSTRSLLVPDKRFQRATWEGIMIRWNYTMDGRQAGEQRREPIPFWSLERKPDVQAVVQDPQPISSRWLAG